MIQVRRSLTAMVAVSAVMLVALFAASGCVRVPIDREIGEVSQRGADVELEGAERADVTISMGAGELFMDAGTSRPGRLMEAEFDYSPRSWEPEVAYEARNGRGVLEVRQPRASGLPSLGAGITNRWEIVLSDEVPIALEVNLGAGQSELLLGDLDLRDLEVSTGAGDVLVDFAGAGLTQDLRATVEGGAGSFRVRVPSSAGVRVSGIRDGLGAFRADGFTRDGDDYVNDAYGRASVTIDLRVSRGVGEIVIEEVD